MRRAVILLMLAACSGEGAGPSVPVIDASNDVPDARVPAPVVDAAMPPAHEDAGSAHDAANVAPSEPVIGGPGCGLDHAAFCDTFDAPSAHRGRAGELDARLWSAGHIQPSLPTSPGFTFGIGPATLRECRSDLPAQVFPGGDAVICDPIATVPSHHLLVAAGAQNYGATSLRVRQPFDFKDRTGTIVFDASGHVINPLLGWLAISITEDPMAVPSYAILGNDEGGVVPRNGVEIHMARNCGDSVSSAPRMIALYEERVESIVSPPDGAPCVTTRIDAMNHFEIRVSQSRIEVWVTPLSEDGAQFEPLQLLMSADVDLPFTRGYVTAAVHNHATIKYSEQPSGYTDTFYDSWIVRWDNFGFDGPVIQSTREYEVPHNDEPGDNVVNIGYRIADAMDGPSATLVLDDVDLTGAVSARIAQTSYYLLDADPSTYLLRYRVNGHAWHDRPLDSGELHALAHNSNGALAQLLDVPLEELQGGRNTIEYVTQAVPQSYPPAVLNVDLVLGLE